jgi:predicted TIM-barrel fold metal-dependent hydrolase
MPILDSQVHAYERNHPGRPWVGTLYRPTEVTGDQMVAAMDAVGVDGAILVSPFSMYRYDASYALEVYAAHPDRFRLVKPVDPTDPASSRRSPTGPAPRAQSAFGSFCETRFRLIQLTLPSTACWLPRHNTRRP